MSKAQGRISAVFQFNQYGTLKGVFLNSENEIDSKLFGMRSDIER